MKTVEGLNGIKATVLAYSVNKAGENLITWEIEYPRLILAELNTHRMLSRNSFSSRAVPFKKMLEQLTGEPVRFGANQAGMQDKGEHFDAPVIMGAYNLSPKQAWYKAKMLAISVAQAFADAGYHKQIYNRLLESWQMQKSVVSATEVDNFFWLRDDDQADPTIHELARVMRQAMAESTPELLEAGQWHLPYIDIIPNAAGIRSYYIHAEDGSLISLTVDEAIAVSCARCAAVSYRNEGYGLDKSIEIFQKLMGSDKKHASAFEHCGTPMKEADRTRSINIPTWFETWEQGVTHVTRDGKLWSGNFKGFIQFRKTVPGECYNAA